MKEKSNNPTGKQVADFCTEKFKQTFLTYPTYHAGDEVVVKHNARVEGRWLLRGRHLTIVSAEPYLSKANTQQYTYTAVDRKGDKISGIVPYQILTVKKYRLKTAMDIIGTVAVLVILAYAITVIRLSMAGTAF